MTTTTQSAAVEALEVGWEPRKKYAVRAIMNGSAVKVGEVLAHSWHPAGMVEGIQEDTELDGTAGFEIDGPEEVGAAVRLAKWFFGGDISQFAIIRGDSLGKCWMPEDGGVLVCNAVVVSVFTA